MWSVSRPEPSWTCSWRSIWPWFPQWMCCHSEPGSSCHWIDPPGSYSHGDGIQLSPVDAHEPVLEVGIWDLTPVSLKLSAKAHVTGIGEELTFCAGEPVSLVQKPDPIPCRKIVHQSTSLWNSWFNLILWWRCWAFMDVSIIWWRKALPGLQTWHMKWSFPTRDRMDCLVADQWPTISVTREIVLGRWVLSIQASMATESISTPRKFLVVAGFVTLSELMANPSSSHIAIMVAMLLVQTGKCGGPTVKLSSR